MPLRYGRRWLLLAALIACCCGCITARNRTYPRSFSPSPIPEPSTFSKGTEKGESEGVTGVWEGISSADCIGVTIGDLGRCGATQKITLTMVQQGDAITGFYQCAYGNRVCRNLDENGIIRNGSMTGRRLLMRVMLEDGSMCFFTGMPLNDVLEGRYSCLQGGGVVERGAFRTARSY
jgi:hypothetical protein